MFAVLAANVALALIPALLQLNYATSYLSTVIGLAGMLGFNAGVALAAWRLSARHSPASPASPPAATSALLLVESAAAETKQALHAIMGFSELLSAGGLRDAEAARRYCGFIAEDTRALNLFAAQLHDYARFERGTLRLLEQEVDAAELITASLNACEALAERSNTFIRADLTESAELHCDAARIRDAVTSIVAWLIASSATGSSVDVTLTRADGGGIAITARTPSHKAAEVSRDRLFEPQLPLNGLNGLALPIARRVALLHSGDVTVETAQGAGTSASLSLPANRVVWPEKPGLTNSRAA